MLLQSIVLVASAFAASPALALEFPAPRATNVGADIHNLLGFSPAPTTPPSPQDLRKRGLLDRRAATTDTCGYLEGVETDSYTCGIGSACAWNTVDSYFGCCSVDGSGNFIASDCPQVANPYTSCYPYSWATDCTGTCYTENRVCPSSAPYCAVGYLVGTTGTYTQYFCNTIEENASITLYSTFTTSADAAAGTTNNNIISNIVTVTVPASSGTGSASHITPSGSKKKTNVGAIAGGVVGGLLFLAAIAGSTILFLHKRKVAQRQQATMEVSQVGQ